MPTLGLRVCALWLREYDGYGLAATLDRISGYFRSGPCARARARFESSRHIRRSRLKIEVRSV